MNSRGHHLCVTGDYPPLPGGQSRYLRGLWGGFPRSRATVIAPRTAHVAPPESAEGGPRVVRVALPLGRSSAARIVRTSLLGLHALRFARRLDVEAVHAGQIMAAGTAAMACRRLRGLRYTLVAHGADVLEFARHPLAGRLASAILRDADRIVANSRFTAGELVRLGADPARIRVLHPVVDAARFRAEGAATALRARYGLALQTVLLTVGRLVPRKGHDTILQALPSVLRAHPHVHYLVVGDGPARRGLERLAEELGVRDRVTFAGYLPDEDLPACYAGADLFVMVSRERSELGGVEGFGIVYLEASAAARAVVAGRSGGVADVVEDGVSGVLVDPEDPDALARTLIRLLEDPPLRRRLALAGHRRVHELFSAERCRAAFQEVIDELACGH